MENTIITETGAKLLVGHILSESDLTKKELEVWSMKDVVIKSIGGMPLGYSKILLVETIKYYDDATFVEGTCNFVTSEIYISRACLYRPELFLGTLLHEIAHARSGAGDETRKFESELSDLLGYISTSLVNAVHNDASQVITSKSLGTSCFGYAKLRCLSCLGTEFDLNKNDGSVKCEKCGKIYESQQELINRNREYIEDHGIGMFLGDLIF